MRVAKKNLLAIAGAVWCIAGANIVNIGLSAYGALGGARVVLVLGSVIVCALFWFGVFSKLVGKHTVRIGSMEEAMQPIWRFFDAKSYLIMAVMMGGGISLRAFGLVPTWFIAFFYTGLGVALAAAGVGFLIAYARARRAVTACA